MPGLVHAQAWAATHRKQLLAAGGAVAVGLGLYSARNRAAGGADEGDGTDSAVAAQGTYGVRQPADDATGGDAYDSTGNDVYNALQPQLEENQSLITRLLETVQNIPKSIPVTGVPRRTTKPKKKPKKGGRGSKKKRRTRSTPKKGHPLRHPNRGPHHQGGKVTHHQKAGGRTVPHHQAHHQQAKPTHVHAGSHPVPRRRR